MSSRICRRETFAQRHKGVREIDDVLPQSHPQFSPPANLDRPKSPSTRKCWGSLAFLAACAIALNSQAIAAEEAPRKDAAVWAIDDTDKVHPITGNLLSEGLETYKGRQPSHGAYRKNNSVWNSSTKTIKLFSGRNEFIAFQVVIERGREDLHQVFVNVSDLLGSEERISADHNVRLFKQLYVRLNGDWYPDALVPFEIAGTTPFELADHTGPLPEQKVQSVWFDIYVPHDLPVGAYTGQITILHRSIYKLATLNVELEVGNFTLPDELGVDVDLMNYAQGTIDRGWPNVVLDGERNRAIEREFFRMAHAHRMTFSIVPYNHDGSIPKGLAPELAGTGDKLRVRDWKEWDDRFGPVLSGEAFADLPRGRQPVNHFFLPFNLAWPSDMHNWGKPNYRLEYLRLDADFRNHLAEKGWTKTLYEIYYNHKEQYGFFPWDLDEPTRDEDFEALRSLGNILHEGFPANDPVRVVFRLDIGHFHCENVTNDAHPRATSRTAVTKLGALVDLWNINSLHYWANLAEVRKLKAAGKIVYFYSGTPVVTEPLLNAAFWGWKAYEYEADGICFWNATDWGDWGADAPPGDPYTNAGGHYQGFSMIFYPGAKFGYDGPIPSIRLKAMRRGLQDYEYLRMIEKSGRKTHADLNQMAEELQIGKAINYPKIRRAIYELLGGSFPHEKQPKTE
jgi:hypothetical protein